jgi:2-polyprenyl-3-methyl-5-hydroxy-6-metoxy-1,4-benzoquinol methylase
VIDDSITFETWDKGSKIYEDKFMDFNLYNESYDIICNTIYKVNAKILDIGCGPGNIIKYLISK